MGDTIAYASDRAKGVRRGGPNRTRSPDQQPATREEEPLYRPLIPIEAKAYGTG